jgi:tetratricopeptide (TPR) repeat protein
LVRMRELAEQFESEATSKMGLKGAAASEWFGVATSAAAMGDASVARAAIDRALGLDRGALTLLNVAFALAVIGDEARAESIVAEARALPLADSDDAQTGFHLIDSLLKMRRRDRSALESLPPPKDENATALQFVAGVVNLAFGNDDVAARQFKKIIDHTSPSISTLAVEANLYHGRALAKLGKIDESRKSYDQFFDLWKNADAGLPILATAKREYAALGH